MERLDAFILLQHIQNMFNNKLHSISTNTYLLNNSDHRKVGKREICEMFIGKLRARGNPSILVDDPLVAGIREHFMSLPSR